MQFSIKKNNNKKGFFKVNLKKTGVEYSIGIPGYTLTKSLIKKQNNANPSKHNRKALENLHPYELQRMQPVEYKDLLKKISSLIKINLFSTYLCWTCILTVISAILYLFLPSIYYPLIITSTLTLIGIILKLYSHSIGKIKLQYEMDKENYTEHSERIQTWSELMKSQKIWKVIGLNPTGYKNDKSNILPLTQRYPVTISSKTPYFLKTNAPTLQLKLKNETFVFLPDKLLILHKSKIGAIKYKDLTISTQTIPYVETETPPKDAIIIDYTWKYVNKDGTPDKRYKNNTKYPICHYAMISITSEFGFNIILHCSNVNSINKFYTFINTPQLKSLNS